MATTAQHEVADAMSRDIDHQHPERGPAFLLHLGDILYGSDKKAGYANRFYRPNDNYHNFIFAIPGNHDGEMRSVLDASSLEAYFINFCQPAGQQPPLAQTFGVTMPHQPGAYWRFTVPFVDIVGLYSGTGENYGSIAHAEIGDQQKKWLLATLQDIATERAAGTKQALVIAVHHPPYASGLQSGGFGHPGNPDMLGDIDDCCKTAGVWPDLVLSAHAHQYQRYTRAKAINGQTRMIPYLIAGTGGIGTQPAPQPIGAKSGEVTYENGVESHGFLTMTFSPTKFSITFTKADGNHRDIFETKTVDLATGQFI